MNPELSTVNSEVQFAAGSAPGGDRRPGADCSRLFPLRVLVVEDSEDDAELLLHALSAGGYDVTSARVETAAAMRSALAGSQWDLIVSEYSLPSFSGPGALAVLREAGHDLPFIIVSGTVGEEAAVAALKAGAHDFLVKGRLARLVPAVERELRDVAQRREHARAQQALRESEAKHRALIERAVFGICQATTQGRLLTVNPALVAILGYGSAEELLSANLADLYIDAAARAEFFSRLRAHAQFSGEEAFWRRKTGDPVRVRLSGRAITVPESDTPVVEFLVEDTTEGHLLEGQLRQAQKMEAIGHLAGGIAHDFNNLLTAILGYAAMVVEQVRDRAEVVAEVDEIIRAGQRASRLTSQLLAFSRKQVLAPKIVDLNQIVGGIEKLLRRVIGEDIHLESNTRARGNIKADSGQLEQVLLNLAVNARDAMPAGGILTIATANTVLPADLARLTGDGAAAGYIALTVTDTGSGMSPEVLARIFEPFFTTKGPDKGTGLGLSTVYGIIVQSGGHVTVESEPGRGTTFTVYLPVVEGVLESIVSTPPAVRSLAGSETILLVEDEPAIRELVRRILSRCGYSVLSGQDVASALHMAKHHPRTIDLLITDIKMPGMNGPDLAQRVVFDRPDIKVLYISGFADDAPGVVARNPRTSFLQKPFTLDQIAGKVWECLHPAV